MSSQDDEELDSPSCILEMICGEVAKAEVLMNVMDKQVAGVNDTRNKMKGVLQTMKMLVPSGAKAGGSTAYEQEQTAARTDVVHGHGLTAVRCTYEQEQTAARTDVVHHGHGLTALLDYNIIMNLKFMQEDTIPTAGGMTSGAAVDVTMPDLFALNNSLE